MTEVATSITFAIEIQPKDGPYEPLLSVRPPLPAEVVDSLPALEHWDIRSTDTETVLLPPLEGKTTPYIQEAGRQLEGALRELGHRATSHAILRSPSQKRLDRLCMPISLPGDFPVRPV